MKNSGDIVEKGNILLTFESMKMETRIVAKQTGRIVMLVGIGDVLPANTPLCRVEPVE